LPQIPLGGLPVMPGQDPYDIDRFGRIEDSNDWQLWWSFNKDRFLRFSNIQTGRAFTGSDDFYLGSGQRERETVGGRAQDRVIDGILSDALLKGLEKGGSNEFCQSALIAMTRVGGENQGKFDWVTSWFLANGTDEMHPTAAFVLGLTGNASRLEMLREIALNTKEGCKLISPEDEHPTARVPMSMRSYAAYGLGMIGSKSTDQAVRSQVVRTLIDILENDASDANDARVAAMISLGLVPLHVDEDVVACYCGTCVVPDPHTSLRPQVTYLMRYFTADEEFDPILRAHTATTLGRLVAARPDGMTQRMKEGVSEVLVRALEKSARQPRQVRESATLALGLIGDADNDNTDKWIRWALRRSMKSGGDMERRFAMISLAEVGGHAGQGDEPYAGIGDVRNTLTRGLASGKKKEKAWAAIALGVLGHELRAKGIRPDSGVDTAILSSMRSAKRVADLGAYSIAMGLRGTSDAAPRLLKKLDQVRDEDARGYVAMSLGMVGAREAIESLQETLVDAEEQPLLQTRTGLALGMLGDESVAESLLEVLNASLDDEDGDARQIAAVSALGYIGDKRGVEILCEIVTDKEDKYSVAVRETAVVALGLCGDRTSRPWRTMLTMGSNYLANTKTLTSGAGTGVLDLK
ncbi:MAG: hypothetical protein P8R43_06430, partial [Planctomycetota bacterium]|nr:hypothetical protein [Planctomycetota bacterium]